MNLSNHKQVQQLYLPSLLIDTVDTSLLLVKYAELAHQQLGLYMKSGYWTAYPQLAPPVSHGITLVPMNCCSTDGQVNATDNT